MINVGNNDSLSQKSSTPLACNISLSIKQEIQRFESVHPSIYAVYDLLELIDDRLIVQKIREHVVCIEGKSLIFIKEELKQKIKIKVYYYF